MARRIKYYEALSPVWRKQILTDLKYKTLNLLDVAINQARRKAVLVNHSDEEWLVILNFSTNFYEDEDDEDDDDGFSNEDESASLNGDIQKEL